MSKPSLSKVKKKVWTTFSKYIRTKYSKDGYCECFTCGRSKPIKEAQAGHGIGGRTNAILFLEEIVRPQCYGCNIGKGGHYEIFVLKLIDLYGRDGYEEFIRLKNTTVKFTIPELLEMEAEWKAQIKELEGR